MVISNKNTKPVAATGLGEISKSAKSYPHGVLSSFLADIRPVGFKLGYPHGTRCEGDHGSGLEESRVFGKALESLRSYGVVSINRLPKSKVK